MIQMTQRSRYRYLILAEVKQSLYGRPACVIASVSLFSLLAVALILTVTAVWMNEIETASKKCLEAEKRAVRKIPSA